MQKGEILKRLSKLEGEKKADTYSKLTKLYKTWEEIRNTIVASERSDGHEDVELARKYFEQKGYPVVPVGTTLSDVARYAVIRFLRLDINDGLRLSDTEILESAGNLLHLFGLISLTPNPIDFLNNMLEIEAKRREVLSPETRIEKIIDAMTTLSSFPKYIERIVRFFSIHPEKSLEDLLSTIQNGSVSDSVKYIDGALALNGNIIGYNRDGIPVIEGKPLSSTAFNSGHDDLRTMNHDVVLKPIITLTQLGVTTQEFLSTVNQHPEMLAVDATLNPVAPTREISSRATVNKRERFSDELFDRLSPKTRRAILSLATEVVADPSPENITKLRGWLYNVIESPYFSNEYVEKVANHLSINQERYNISLSSNLLAVQADKALRNALDSMHPQTVVRALLEVEGISPLVLNEVRAIIDTTKIKSTGELKVYLDAQLNPHQLILWESLKPKDKKEHVPGYWLLLLHNKSYNGTTAEREADIASIVGEYFSDISPNGIIDKKTVRYEVRKLLGERIDAFTANNADIALAIKSQVSSLHEIVEFLVDELELAAKTLVEDRMRQNEKAAPIREMLGKAIRFSTNQKGQTVVFIDTVTYPNLKMAITFSISVNGRVVPSNISWKEDGGYVTIPKKYSKKDFTNVYRATTVYSDANLGNVDYLSTYYSFVDKQTAAQAENGPVVEKLSLQMIVNLLLNEENTKKYLIGLSGNITESELIDAIRMAKEGNTTAEEAFIAQHHQKIATEVVKSFQQSS